MGFSRKRKPQPPLPKLEIISYVNETEVHLGDELKGVVRVKSGEELDIEEIWVELRCVESKKKISGSARAQDDDLVYHEEEYWDEADLYSGPFSHLQISGPLHVNIGFDSEFPFIVKIPSFGRETYLSIDHYLQWLLREHVKVKGSYVMSIKGGNIFVNKPLVSGKEIVREVVLIPCAYCSGLMPQTSTFCPNCGARRKRN